MPPEIVDIVIKAWGEFVNGILDPIDILIKATPYWIDPFIDIVLRATPGFGIPFIVMCGFFLMMAWWFWEPERG